jgi:hypothetical protein
VNMWGLTLLVAEEEESVAIPNKDHRHRWSQFSVIA